MFHVLVLVALILLEQVIMNECCEWLGNRSGLLFSKDAKIMTIILGIDPNKLSNDL